MTKDEGANAVYSYKVTKDSIYHAMLQGRTSTQIIDFFKEYSKTGLADNIEESILGWADRFGQVFFLDAFLLCCKKESLVKEILNVPEMNQYVLGSLNEKVLLVKKEDYEKLLTELVSNGYMPYKDLYVVNDMPFSPVKEGDK